jgi:hypothetical protein
VLIERMLVRAPDELVGVVALQLHAKHARQGVRLAAKHDSGHFFWELCLQLCDTTILIPFSYDRYRRGVTARHFPRQTDPPSACLQGRGARRKGDPTLRWMHS